MKKVTAPQVATAREAMKADLPEAVQEALGDLAGAAREGLLALSVGLGLGVVHELMAAEAEEVRETVTVRSKQPGPPEKFNGTRDILRTPRSHRSGSRR